MCRNRVLLALAAAALLDCATEGQREEVLQVSLRMCEVESCPDAKHGAILHELAFYYMYEKKPADLAKAESYGQQAVEVRKKAFGRSPAVATSLDNLGLIYSAESRHDDALRVHTEACEMFDSTNANPLDRGICLNNVASELEVLGRLSEAEARYQQALDVFDRGGVKTSDPHYKTLAANLSRCRAKEAGPGQP